MFTDIISYEIAATRKGIDPTFRPDYSMFSDSYRKAKEAEFMLDIIIEQANNDPEFPDYSDTTQPKYELWLWVKGATKENLSGSGLSFSVDLASSRAGVGSRRKFVSEAVARFVFKTFYQLFVDSYLNNQ